MRALVAAFLAIVAGVLAWTWAKPACPDGVAVRDEAECRTKTADERFCRMAFAEAARRAPTLGPSYPNGPDCAQDWPRCMQVGADGRHTPIPTRWRMTRAGDGSLACLAPLYEDRRR